MSLTLLLQSILQSVLHFWHSDHLMFSSRWYNLHILFILTHWVVRYTNIQGSQPSSFIIYPLFVHSLSFLTNQLNLYLPKIVYLNELFPAWFSTFILINILYKNTFLADREELTLFILYFKEGQRGNKKIHVCIWNCMYCPVQEYTLCFR